MPKKTITTRVAGMVLETEVDVPEEEVQKPAPKAVEEVCKVKPAEKVAAKPVEKKAKPAAKAS